MLRSIQGGVAESALAGIKSFLLSFDCVVDGGSLTLGYLYFGVRILRHNEDLLASLGALQTPSWVQNWQRETLK